MKLKNLLLLVPAFILTVSCENYQSEYESAVLEQQLLQEDLAKLQEEEKLIKGEYAETLQTLTEIEDSLSIIAVRNKQINKLLQQKKIGKDADQKQKIEVILSVLYQANEQSNKKANALRSKARAINVENQQIKKMVAQLETKFVQIEQEIAGAKSTIDSLNMSLGQLEGQLSQKSSELADAYTDLTLTTNTLEGQNSTLKSTIAEIESKNSFIQDDANAYILCNTARELRKSKIITLLSKKRLSKNYQTEVAKIGAKFDYFNDAVITCDNKSILYLLPERDPSTYEIDGPEVKIINKKAFWATSKIVILVKK